MKQDEVVGLDIGSWAIKVIQMRKEKGRHIATKAGIVAVGAEDQSDDARWRIYTATAIRAYLKIAGIKTKSIVCGVGGSDVAVRCFKFPPMPADEIEGAVALEAAQVCPFDVERDGVIDYQLISNDENNIVGILVAATKQSIARKRRIVRDASFDAALMDVDSLALLNCLEEYEQSEHGLTTAILNVGSSHTNLAITQPDSVPFVRDIAYGGRIITKHMAADKNASEETVARILYNEEQLSEPQSELHSSLAKACRELITEVSETFRYYAAERQSSVKRVLVCGGFAMVKGFVELINSQLTAEAVLWNPFDRIPYVASLHSKRVLRQTGPAMAVAAGLAMRSV